MKSEEKLKEGIKQILQIIREDRNTVAQTRNHLLKVKRGLDCIDEKLKLGSHSQKDFEIPTNDLIEKGREMIKEGDIKILLEKIRRDSELSYEISKISKNQEGVQTYYLVFNNTREFEKYRDLITTQYNIIEPICQKLKSGEDINPSFQLVQELNEEIDIIIMEYDREREKFICDMNNRGLLWSGGRNLGEYEIERKVAVAISRKIRELVDKYQMKEIQNHNYAVNSNQYLVYRDSRGDYFYNGKQIVCPKSALYYKIFDILYSNADQGNFLSYEDIENELVKKKITTHCKDKQTRDKRIKNAIFNGFFRYAKRNGKRVKNKTLDGKKLVEVVRGEGLILNNSRL